MKRTPLLTLWALSFATTALFANAMNIIFWLSLIVFCICSVYIEKNSKRLKKEEN